MAETVLIAVAIGVLVPVLLLIGPYLPYLLPVRDRLPGPEANRFAEGLLAGLGLRRGGSDEGSGDVVP